MNYKQSLVVIAIMFGYGFGVLSTTLITVFFDYPVAITVGMLVLVFALVCIVADIKFLKSKELSEPNE